MTREDVIPMLLSPLMGGSTEQKDRILHGIQFLRSAEGAFDLDEIRDRAINELGMQYATEDQIRYYTPGNNSYVRQYQDVPEN